VELYQTHTFSGKLRVFNPGIELNVENELDIEHANVYSVGLLQMSYSPASVRVCGHAAVETGQLRHLGAVWVTRPFPRSKQLYLGPGQQKSEFFGQYPVLPLFPYSL
jgi:hypothetical protein